MQDQPDWQVVPPVQLMPPPMLDQYVECVGCRGKTYTVPKVLELLHRLQLGRLGPSPALQELPSDTCCVRSFEGKSLVDLECLNCSNAKENESEETNVPRSTSK